MSRIASSSVLPCAWLLVVCSLPGCAGSNKGEVSGEVSYGGQAVTEGTVHFHMSERGIGAMGKLDAAGKFTLPAPLETGAYVVWVTPPPVEPGQPGTSPPAAKEYPNIPLKSREPATSGLKRDVKAGANHFKIDLKN